MFITLKTEVEFSASHYLPGHKGKCAQVHGHTWKVKVEYLGLNPDNIPDDGILVDFGDIKDTVMSNFDHCNLNDLIRYPTAENIALYLFKLMPEVWHQSYTLVVTVWESKSSKVIVSGIMDFRNENDRKRQMEGEW